MSEKTKIILWGVPRSVSTAFYVAMYNRPRTKCYCEMYGLPYYFGADRVSERYSDHPVVPTYTYNNTREQLEADLTEDNEVLFTKEIAYYMIHVFGADAYKRLPKGFVHTFLIRDPSKSVPSYYELCAGRKLQDKEWNYFEPKEAGFKEQYELYTQITDILGQKVIVMDGDELKQQPEKMLKAFCKEVGISYHDSMVNWKISPKDCGLTENWEPGWFQSLFKTNRLEARAGKEYQLEDFPELVHQVIQDAKPYYEKLHRLRLRP